ncbi:hypothetical protein CYMTET_28893 [Cymbomonas tetramitiformis]|uniref:Uncharacterized protein n=1 Tax=Cymbomonas tetramitiformis TaxID=36881 RepID=A0AAE0FLW7_9CHLO|nr:hypothetical protein CYMTET_28893 [Cymbomonas tetramitiformis]
MSRSFDSKALWVVILYIAQFSGVDDSESTLVQGLLKKSKDKKEEYDQDRLDRYYNREYNINKLSEKLGMGEVLAEPCDPRDPEFTKQCSRLPYLPEDRAALNELPTNSPRLGTLINPDLNR